MLNESNFIGFYDETKENGYLSNWYKASFEYAGRKFAHAEQFMMYQKMMTFGHPEIAEKILETDDQYGCKQLGKSKISNWDSDLWDKIRYQIVKRGIKAKFFQNKDLAEKLLSTGDKLLAECSGSDKNWGIGISDNDPRRFDVSNWSGQNLLGRCLMDVREEFRKLSEMSLPRFIRSEYRSAYDLPAIPEWEMTIGELMRIPKYRSTVAAYNEVCRWYLKGHKNNDVSGITLAMAEDMIRTNKGSDLPVQGFWELKQDLYDISNDYYINASGFSAPVVGQMLPDDEELVKGPNGNLIRVKKKDKGEQSKG